MNDALLTLSSCAQNILDELKRHKDRILKSREDDLIKLSKMQGIRIIEAREQLKTILDELKEHNLITYEKKGGRYIIINIERN
jgi:hypothetical protein